METVMQWAKEILIGGVNEYSAEIIGKIIAVVIPVILGLCKYYHRSILTCLKYILLAIIGGIAMYIAVRFLGVPFLAGFVVAAVAGRFFARRHDDFTSSVPVTELTLIERIIASSYKIAADHDYYAVHDDKAREILEPLILSLIKEDSETNMKHYVCWLERAAEHGNSSAQSALVDTYSKESNSEMASMWLYVEKLCGDYVRNLGEHDRKICLEIGCGSLTVNDDTELKTPSKSSTVRKARAKFKRVKKFIINQIREYKSEHPETCKSPL